MVSCGLPMCRVTKFPEGDMGQAVSMWKGLWSMCYVESLGDKECTAYHSPIAGPVGLQVFQVLMITCVVTTSLDFLLLLTETWVCVIFLGSGLMMVSVSLATHNFIHGFSNLLLGSRDGSLALYRLGQLLLILLGGALLWKIAQLTVLSPVPQRTLLSPVPQPTVHGDPRPRDGVAHNQHQIFLI
ncbi:claudin-13-like [Nannospalax galili]|uniref:claudin-13-like n=1 Tax=Nannospalax galili TaxID=1026970 RepID=UPI00111BF939|nr:claudin-13-like [Nannospalax galili]